MTASSSRLVAASPRLPVPLESTTVRWLARMLMLVERLDAVETYADVAQGKGATGVQ